MGVGLIYLQNKPSRPWGRAAQSSECTCAPTGGGGGGVTVLRLLPPEEILQQKQEICPAGLPVLCGLVFPGFFFFFNPWTLQDNMEASRSDDSSLARVAAFVGALVAGYFREAWPMCLGGVRAYWPR